MLPPSPTDNLKRPYSGESDDYDINLIAEDSVPANKRVKVLASPELGTSGWRIVQGSITARRLYPPAHAQTTLMEWPPLLFHTRPRPPMLTGLKLFGKSATGTSTSKQYTDPLHSTSGRQIPVHSLQSGSAALTVDTDTELAQTVFAMCQQRDSLNEEVKEWYNMLVERLKKLKEEAAALAAIQALEAEEGELDQRFGQVAEEIATVHEKPRAKLGTERYNAWLVSHGSNSHMKPTLPAAFKGLSAGAIKAKITVPSDTVTVKANTGSSRARRVRVATKDVAGGKGQEDSEAA
ncbi:hypothetical protein C8R44DRAFT_739334 [Mycena epipterygia]|nr:hypothetical protein C8R44DRAFT_739334 [Mycena epipterygia]